MTEFVVPKVLRQDNSDVEFVMPNVLAGESPAEGGGD